jgi:hypothetical protein
MEGMINPRLGTDQGSARSHEALVTLCQEVSIRLEVVDSRHVDVSALEALEAVLEHRAVDLLEHVEADLDLEVGCDADDVGIEGRVMQLAQREAVGNHWLSQGMAVGQDMGSVQQLVMAEPADGTALTVGTEHTLAKAALVQTLANR